MAGLNTQTQNDRLARAEARWPGTSDRVRELRRLQSAQMTLREVAQAYNKRNGSSLHASNVKRLLDAYPSLV